MSDKDIIYSDDDLVFVDEEGNPQLRDTSHWKVMIVDDEPEVHNVTKMVLSDFQFAGRGLDFISAYSGQEAREALSKNPDVAMILLDVVMETEDAGLRFAQYIREEAENRLVRIVLRTGQPGMAPEEHVILNYDINDYKAKTELTATKLFTTVVSALRSYRDIKTLETNKKGLETILRASSTIFELQAMEQFAAGVLTQLTALLRMEEDALYAKTNGFAAMTTNREECRILIGTGIYAECTNQKVDEVVDEEVLACLKKARAAGRELFLDQNRYVGYFRHENGSENFLYLQGWEELNEWDRYLLEIFCKNVSIAYENIGLNLELLETQREVIFKLGETVETRSRETGNHVKRVAEYSALLARACGLSDEQAKIIRFASPMHDLGKIGVPDAILNKPGKLTPEEFKVIQQHTTVGYEMLRHSNRELFKAAAIIALQHHERYDGSGYPNGVKGDDIHLYGRITAIADTFDALGVRRVYKEAWPLEDILKYFEEERGGHFDPKLVDIFLDNLDSFLSIRDSFPDVPDDFTHSAATA